jgi:hypothetical protein
MPAYRVEVLSEGKWLKRGIGYGRHAQEAIRNMQLADKAKLPRRAFRLPDASDYRVNEDLNTPINPPG